MMYFKKLQSQFINAYGVGSGNAPARAIRVGHLWAFSYILTNSYVTHIERSQTCDPCARI